MRSASSQTPQDVIRISFFVEAFCLWRASLTELCGYFWLTFCSVLVLFFFFKANWGQFLQTKRSVRPRIHATRKLIARKFACKPFDVACKLCEHSYWPQCVPPLFALTCCEVFCVVCERALAREANLRRFFCASRPVAKMAFASLSLRNLVERIGSPPNCQSRTQQQQGSQCHRSGDRTEYIFWWKLQLTEKAFVNYVSVSSLRAARIYQPIPPNSIFIVSGSLAESRAAHSGGSRILVRVASSVLTLGGPWAQNLLKIGVFPLSLPKNCLDPLGAHVSYPELSWTSLLWMGPPPPTSAPKTVFTPALAALMLINAGKLYHPWDPWVNAGKRIAFFLCWSVSLHKSNLGCTSTSQTHNATSTSQKAANLGVVKA